MPMPNQNQRDCQVTTHGTGVYWPKALAKRTRKSTQVLDCVQLGIRLATHLNRLALTLVELKFARK